MNDDNFQNLERLLRDLALEQPSVELDRRVESVWLGPASRPRRRRLVGAGAALAVAASLLLGAGLWLWRSGQEKGEGGGPKLAGKEKADNRLTAREGNSPILAARKSGQSPSGQSPPIRIERVWSMVSARKVVIAEGAQPVQQVQREVVREVQWIDSQQHARIQWTIPSQETDLVPLEYN